MWLDIMVQRTLVQCTRSNHFKIQSNAPMKYVPISVPEDVAAVEPS